MTRAHDRQNTLPQRRCTSCTKIPSVSCSWHGVVGENLLDDGRQLGAGRFCIAPRIYTGCTALGLSYEGDDWDDQLYEEECVRYLRGEPWRRPLNPLSASLIRE